jgi:Asp-tRNA(Asn)/Glu-tRNA(Gln) amidotransferase A subunit family amidase
MNEFYRLTISEAVTLMRKGDLTVEDYAKSLLARVKARDPVINAWAYLDAEFVLAQARKLHQIPPEKRGPLHGVAVGIKDIILTKGLHFFVPSAYSFLRYRHYRYANLPQFSNI